MNIRREQIEAAITSFISDSDLNPWSHDNGDGSWTVDGILDPEELAEYIDSRIE